MLMGVSKKVEFAANVAIIVVACLLAVVLAKNYLFVRSSGSVSAKPAASQGVNTLNASSLDINWKQNGQTLVLALSNSCHFCTQSAPFYRKLAQTKGSASLVAVLPQSVEDGRKCLDRLGVAVDEVRQVPLDRIGVRGTPTLVLLDASGAVKNSWVGFLPPEAELDVLKAVKGE